MTGAETATGSTGAIGTTDPAKARGNVGQQPTDQAFEDAHPRGGAGTAAGGRFVKKGSEGAQVEQTQQQLNKADGAGLKTDSKFGPKTEAAVRGFQQKQGLAVDGIVGPQTTSALKAKVRELRQSQKYAR
jgi:peptidoglycan hydrolase-like protein with peptidoglycan-binding domain